MCIRQITSKISGTEPWALRKAFSTVYRDLTSANDTQKYSQMSFSHTDIWEKTTVKQTQADNTVHDGPFPPWKRLGTQ